MLQFIYTGELGPFCDITTNRKCNHLRRDFYSDLLRIGHMYNIEKLVNACAFKLAINLDRENIFVSLELAEEFGAKPLRDAAITFIAENENLKTLIDRQEFAKIVKPSADLLFAILRKTVYKW
jgi:hypothetical protein